MITNVQVHGAIEDLKSAWMINLILDGVEIQIMALVSNTTAVGQFAVFPRYEYTAKSQKHMTFFFANGNTRQSSDGDHVRARAQGKVFLVCEKVAHGKIK